MSRKKWEKMQEEYAEAIKFQDVLKELKFDSIGEFVELIDGVMGMVNVNDIDNAKRICDVFALRIGYIIDKIGYADKVIDKNKTMRDFYEDRQRQLAEQKAAKDQEIIDACEDEDCDEGIGTVTAVDSETTDEAAEQLKRFNEKEYAKKTSTDLNDEAVITFQLDPDLFNDVKEASTAVKAISLGGGWYELSDGQKVRKKNLPENVILEEV